MKKRLLSLILILCLCAALLPVTALAEEPVIELWKDNIDTYLYPPTLTARISNRLLAGSYKLMENIELPFQLGIYKNVTLDLNGHILSFAEAEKVRGDADPGIYIGIDEKGGTGHLTLRDSDPDKSNTLTVDGTKHMIPGGLIYCKTRGDNRHSCSIVCVIGNATFTMEGGSIAFGKDAKKQTSTAGGVHISYGATFNMVGGRIIGCSSKVNGGVYVGQGSTFNMSGGSIEDCHAGGNGGGVYVGADCAFNMTGGEIKNCRAEGNGGGVYVDNFKDTAFNMTGGTIKNCTAGGKGNGVYVADGANATLVRDNIDGEIEGNWTEYIPPVEPEDPDYPLISILPALTKNLPFTDVTSTDWFYNDVKYAYETGLMTGTAADAFSPEAPVTRGMVMTILARREGVRTDRYTPWYAAGCEWAKANGISDGTNPEAPVTREQLAAMLYRYATLKGRDLTAGENTNILSYTDAFDISDYAYPALRWATGEKILTGSNGALSPQAPATRAQLAAILHRYFG